MKIKILDIFYISLSFSLTGEEGVAGVLYACKGAHPRDMCAHHRDRDKSYLYGAHPLHLSERKREREGEIEKEKEGGRESTPAPLQALSTPAP
jgi:hypothetical protein